MPWCTEDEVPDPLCSNLQKTRLRFVGSYNLKVRGDLWLQVRLDSVLGNMSRSQFVFFLSSSWFCSLCVSSIFRQVSLGIQKGHPGYILHPTQWESIPVASQKKTFFSPGSSRRLADKLLPLAGVECGDNLIQT